MLVCLFFFFSSRRRHTRYWRDWSSDVCSSELAVPRRFFATTGISVRKDGTNESEDLSLSAKNALLNMIEHLETRGFTRQQAYALCSVAVELRISQTGDKIGRASCRERV